MSEVPEELSSRLDYRLIRAALEGRATWKIWKEWETIAKGLEAQGEKFRDILRPLASAPGWPEELPEPPLERILPDAFHAVGTCLFLRKVVLPSLGQKTPEGEDAEFMLQSFLARTLAAYIAQQTGRNREEIEEHLASSPTTPALFVRASILLHGEDKTRAALENWGRLIYLDLLNPDPENRLGNWLWIGDYLVALREFKRIAKKDDNKKAADAYTALILSAPTTGAFSAATQYFISVHPQQDRLAETMSYSKLDIAMALRDNSLSQVLVNSGLDWATSGLHAKEAEDALDQAMSLSFGAGSLREAILEAVRESEEARKELGILPTENPEKVLDEALRGRILGAIVVGKGVTQSALAPGEITLESARLLRRVNPARMPLICPAASFALGTLSKWGGLYQLMVEGGGMWQALPNRAEVERVANEISDHWSKMISATKEKPFPDTDLNLSVLAANLWVLSEFPQQGSVVIHPGLLTGGRVNSWELLKQELPDDTEVTQIDDEKSQALSLLILALPRLAESAHGAMTCTHVRDGTGRAFFSAFFRPAAERFLKHINSVGDEFFSSDRGYGPGAAYLLAEYASKPFYRTEIGQFTVEGAMELNDYAKQLAAPGIEWLERSRWDDQWKDWLILKRMAQAAQVLMTQNALPGLKITFDDLHEALGEWGTAIGGEDWYEKSDKIRKVLTAEPKVEREEGESEEAYRRRVAQEKEEQLRGIIGSKLYDILAKVAAAGLAGMGYCPTDEAERRKRDALQALYSVPSPTWDAGWTIAAERIPDVGNPKEGSTNYEEFEGYMTDEQRERGYEVYLRHAERRWKQQEEWRRNFHEYYQGKREVSPFPFAPSLYVALLNPLVRDIFSVLVGLEEHGLLYPLVRVMAESGAMERVWREAERQWGGQQGQG